MGAIKTACLRWLVFNNYSMFLITESWNYTKSTCLPLPMTFGGSAMYGCDDEWLFGTGVAAAAARLATSHSRILIYTDINLQKCQKNLAKSAYGKLIHQVAPLSAQAFTRGPVMVICRLSQICHIHGVSEPCLTGTLDIFTRYYPVQKMWKLAQTWP